MERVKVVTRKWSEWLFPADPTRVGDGKGMGRGKEVVRKGLSSRP